MVFAVEDCINKTMFCADGIQLSNNNTNQSAESSLIDGSIVEDIVCNNIHMTRGDIINRMNVTILHCFHNNEEDSGFFCRCPRESEHVKTNNDKGAAANPKFRTQL